MKKYSLGELSSRADVSKTFLSQIENNRKIPTITTLLKIADALEIKIYQLIGEEQEEYPHEVIQLIDNAKNLDKNQINAIINLINAFSSFKPNKITYDDLSKPTK